jgi:Flp pilus assembly protein TadB
MTAPVVVGLLVGLGVIGVWRGSTARRPSLESIVLAGTTPSAQTPPASEGGGVFHRLGEVGSSTRLAALIRGNGHWARLTPAFAITRTTPEALTAQVILGSGTGALLPPVLWVVAAAAGASVPILVPLALSLMLVGAGAVLPFAVLSREAGRRRHHVRVVVGTYVDLVVLSLAGGVGVEGALISAAEVTPDWAAQRIARALILARTTGEPAWEALGALGRELGVSELEELAATLKLAGTEGARIRQSLSARAVSLRRHEQAEAESEANATTERLFLPGALLLLGFLLFIGYPAVNRIVTGL